MGARTLIECRLPLKYQSCNLDFFFFSGLFNACNKVLVSFEILLEWREYFKEGFPITNIIEAKLRSMLRRVPQVICLTMDDG